MNGKKRNHVIIVSDATSNDSHTGAEDDDATC